MHDLDIPEFLRIPRDYKPPPLKGRKLKWTRDMSFGRERKVIPADTLAFMREQERERKEANNARFKMLREREAERKRAMIK